MLYDLKSRVKEMKFDDKSIEKMQIFNNPIIDESVDIKKQVTIKDRLTESELFTREQFEIDEDLCFVLTPLDQNTIQYMNT